MRFNRRFLLAIAIVCLGGASGYFVARFAGSSSDGPVALQPASRPDSGPDTAGGAAANPVGDPTRDSTAGEQPSPREAPRRIPTDVPNFTLADTGGVRHSISEWKGRPLLINFWATWCTPCRREIPLLKRLRRERSADGIEVIGIAIDFRDAVQRYARDMGIDYPVLVGEQDGLDTIAAFGMDTVFPFTVFADARGRIVTLKIGELHADEAGFILDQVKGIDRGSIALEAARKAIAEGSAALAAARAREAQAGTEPGPLVPDPDKSVQEVP